MTEKMPKPNQAEVLNRFAEHPFANLETYKYFNQRGEQAATAKAVFVEAALAGTTPDSPGFIYPNIDIDEITAHRDELTTSLQDTLNLDMLDESNRLVREKIFAKSTAYPKRLTGRAFWGIAFLCYRLSRCEKMPT